MSAPTVPETPAAAAPEASAKPLTTVDAIAAARQRLAAGRPLLESASEAAVPAAGSDEIPPEGFSVKLEGLAERGEELIEIEAPDEETFNRLNRLQNEAVLGRQVKAERGGVTDAQRELAEVEDMTPRYRRSPLRP